MNDELGRSDDERTLAKGFAAGQVGEWLAESVRVNRPERMDLSACIITYLDDKYDTVFWPLEFF